MSSDDPSAVRLIAYSGLISVHNVNSVLWSAESMWSWLLIKISSLIMELIFKRNEKQNFRCYRLNIVWIFRECILAFVRDVYGTQQRKEKKNNEGKIKIVIYAIFSCKNIKVERARKRKRKKNKEKLWN